MKNTEGIWKQGSKSGCNRAEVMNEMSVEVGKSQEMLQILNRPSGGPVNSCLGFGRVHTSSSCTQDVTQHGDGGDMEKAYLRLEK